MLLLPREHALLLVKYEMVVDKVTANKLNVFFFLNFGFNYIRNPNQTKIENHTCNLSHHRKKIPATLLFFIMSV